MFKKYKLRQLKREKNDRNTSNKILKNNYKQKTISERILIMLKNSSLLLPAFNKILNNSNLLNENIEIFTNYIFLNLMKCKKEKIIKTNIDVIKKIINSENFYKVEEISFNYFKSLFYLNRFPVKLVNIFKIKYKNKLDEDSKFSCEFNTKFL